MKITEVLVSILIKKGVIFEGRNFDVDFDLNGTKVNVKAEHVTIKLDKGEA